MIGPAFSEFSDELHRISLLEMKAAGKGIEENNDPLSFISGIQICEIVRGGFQLPERDLFDDAQKESQKPVREVNA